MPIFEYHCQTCGHTIEVLQRNAVELSTCGEDCVGGSDVAGRGQLVRKMSAHAVLSGGASMSDAYAGSMCGTCGKVPGSCAIDE